MRIFCYICKEHIEVEKPKDFYASGHSSEKLSFLPPNLGRSSTKFINALREKAGIR